MLVAPAPMTRISARTQKMRQIHFGVLLGGSIRSWDLEEFSLLQIFLHKKLLPSHVVGLFDQLNSPCCHNRNHDRARSKDSDL